MQLRGKTLSKLLALLFLSTAAIGSAQNNGQPERSAVKQDANEQQAVEQLRAIVDAIKRCPKAESPEKGRGTYFFSAPQVTGWDVIPRQSARSDWLGYIEFIEQIYYKPNPLPECKKKDSKCQWDNWELNQMNSILESALPPDDWRYEFDVGTHGLEFFRSMVKHQKDDETHWSGISSSLGESCEGDAVTIVVNNRTPQIPVYADGNGVTQDYPQAAARFRKAADQGDAVAQYDLGRAYYNGQGVPQDYAEAYFWFDLAAAGKLDAVNAEGVHKGRDAAATYLTPADLSRAQERARKWFEDHPAKPQ